MDKNREETHNQNILQEECDKRVEGIDSKRTDVPSHNCLKQLKKTVNHSSGKTDSVPKWLWNNNANINSLNDYQKNKSIRNNTSTFSS